MKRIVSMLTSVLLAASLLTGLGAGSFAAVEKPETSDSDVTVAEPREKMPDYKYIRPTAPSDISVVIGDSTVKFFGAKPTDVNNKIYVPLRRFFEVLGADVTYNGSDDTVTCSRYGTTVKFKAGSDSAKVSGKNGDSDVSLGGAVYDSNGTLMVPVRAAAEALGCTVGWSRWESAVLVLDAEGMLQKSGTKFTIMNKLMDINKKDQTSYKFTGNCLISVADGAEAGKTQKITAEFNGLSCAQTVNMNITYDFSDLIDKEAKGQDLTTTAMLAQMKKIDVKFILDLNSKKFYIQSPILSLALHIESDAWLSVSLSDVLPSAGSLGILGTASFEEYISNTVKMIPLTSTAALKSSADSLTQIVNSYSDSVFKKDGDTYTSSYSVSEDGIKKEFLYQFTIKGDKLTSCSLRQVVQSKYSSTTMAYFVDADKNITMTMKTTGGMDMDVKLTMKMTETDKKPVTKPESGRVVDAQELTGVAVTTEEAA